MLHFLCLPCRFFVAVALWVLSSLACATPPEPIFTTTDTAEAYSLDTAFLDAQASDARMRAAQSRITQAQYKLRAARSSKLPTLSVFGNTGYSYNENQARASSEYKGKSLRYGLQASQNVYTFGRISSRLRAAKAEIAVAEQAAEMVRQTILAETGESFSEQLLRGRILDLWRTFELLAVELERVTRQRVALKALDQTELYQVLRRLHQARAERISASSSYLIAQMRLARLTGGASTQKTLLDTSLNSLKTATPATLDDALVQAEIGSPVLKQARQRLAVAQGELEFRKAELLPSLSIDINASNGKVGGTDVASVGAEFKLLMPLYAGGSKRAQLHNAREAVIAERWELEAEQSRIKTEVRAHWHLLDGLTMAQQDFEAALADAQKVAQQVQSKLNARHATLVQAIESQQSVLDAELSLLANNLQLEETRITLLRVLGDLGS